MAYLLENGTDRYLMEDGSLLLKEDDATTVSVAVSGNAGTGGVGTFAAAVVIALSGVVGTGSAGTLAPSSAYGAVLTGNAGTGAAGSLAARASLPVSGVASTGSTGTVQARVSVGLSGLQAFGSIDSLTPSAGYAVALSGSSATGSAGSVAATIAAKPSGVAATASTGSLSPAVSVPILGTQAPGSVGNLQVPSEEPDLEHQVFTLLQQSVNAHRQALPGARQRRNWAAAVVFFQQAYDLRLEAHALDPEHDAEAWNERGLAPRGQSAHEAFIRFYEAVLEI